MLVIVAGYTLAAKYRKLNSMGSVSCLMRNLMHSVKITSLFLSAFILLFGATGGWLFARKGIGHEEAAEFLKFGLCFSFVIFFGKIYIYSRAKKFLFYQLIFLAGFGVEFAWFLSCFFLPLMWLHTVDILIRTVAFSVYMFICTGNVYFAFKEFEQMWKTIDEKDFERKMKSNGNRVGQNNILKSMGIPAVIYVPGLANKHTELVTLGLFIFMVIGIVVRSKYPILSMATLGVAFSIGAACFLQISVYRISEARKILILEKSENIKIASVF
jgi:hypothetical protein